jgi:hypothetical protein
MKFYPSDWRSDPALRMCSMAARGLWIEIIALMHEATPYGHLTINGKAVSEKQLAALCGGSPDEITDLLLELEASGVFSRKKNGVIFSRRMERDEIKSRKNRENGEKGGNPSLSKDNEKEQSLNPEVKAQKPEARSQSPEAESSIVSLEPAERPALCVAVGKKITDAMGVTNDRRWMGNWSSVSVWLAKGYDPELDILPTVLATIDRLKRTKRKMPGSLNYFEKAIEENYLRRIETGTGATKPNVELVVLKKAQPEFWEWIKFWKSEGKQTGFSEKQETITVPTLRPIERQKGVAT